MIGYVAKDRNEHVYLHIEKPVYNYALDGQYSTSEMTDITGQFPEFDDISYEDKPVKVEIKLERI